MSAAAAMRAGWASMGHSATAEGSIIDKAEGVPGGTGGGGPPRDGLGAAMGELVRDAIDIGLG